MATIVQIPIDESGYGAKGDDEAFVFGGFLAPVKLWLTFAHTFDDLLTETPVLTTREFKRRVRWTKKIDERVLRSVGLIKNHSLNAFKFKISNPDFARMNRELAQRNPVAATSGFTRNPYFFAFMATLLLVMAGAHNNPEYKVELIYDENMSERRRLERGYALFREWSKTNQPELLTYLAKDPRPRNDDDFSPLLIADMLAWHAHRDHVETANGREYNNEVWEALKKLKFYADETWSFDDLLDVSVPGRLKIDPKA